MNAIAKFLFSVSMVLSSALYSDAQITGQINFGESVLENRSISITAGAGCLLKDGVMMQDSEIIGLMGESTFDTYRKSRKRYVTGDILTTAGATVLGVGLGYAFGGFIASKITGGGSEDYLVEGGIMAAIGIIPLAIGIPVMVKSQKNIESIADGYKEKRRTGTLSLGTTMSGVGISYNF